VAEELFFGESSSGVAGDLQAATVNACQMIGLLGMGATLVSSAAMEYPAGGIVSKVLSTDEGRAEVEDLLAASKASVTQMLDEHRHVVEGLRDALLQRQELIGDDILAVIRESQPSLAATGLLDPFTRPRAGAEELRMPDLGPTPSGHAE
jgi:cell division protease FtsH